MRRVPPLLFWEGETRAALLVRWAERDPPDRAHGHDELLRAAVGTVDDEREESVARVARERPKQETLAVAELDLDAAALRGVCGRVPLDLPVDALDEVVE